MKYGIPLWFLCMYGMLAAHNTAEVHIVFVHLGNNVPVYAYTAFQQARLFNPDAPITLITNAKALDQSSYDYAHYHITTVACETLPETEWHAHFKRMSKLNARERDGFWRKATERFFYLHEYIALHDIHHAVHMEYDTMLYADMATMAEAFSSYKGIGAVFDSDNRCIPCFMYIANQKAIEHLVQFIATHAHRGYNDMAIIARYHNTFSCDYIDNLPLIMSEYIIDHELVNTKKERPAKPHAYWNNIDKFDSIFDGAALGQYLGGIDPRNGPSIPGFINETCYFNPSYITIEWHVDEKDRNVPFAIYHDKAYRINNLHIHSKNLEKFKSCA